MSLIAKIDPPLTVAENGVAQIHARPYKQAAAPTGEEIFVWTSDMSGGHALAARGTVLTARIESLPNKTGPGAHKELVLEVQIVSAAPLRALTLDQIAPHRDSDAGDDATPEAAAGKLLYTHALNKITSIESEVADFVRSHFEEQ
ncbi:hypothetical protein [Antarcticimicrobium sediminis]|uniref:Uncharacterized protein n=1 Tax=Antarcticimicrobium sediminis TaxID=2546227 RepID=A0A4R5EXW3_9RHOB|nr:hypothetical protein [Antarcticimicrobium sediminis]TDE39637.1 hypothetical protein E1B25_06185 [Antarcticimicrobium sediminis]